MNQPIPSAPVHALVTTDHTETVADAVNNAFFFRALVREQCLRHHHRVAAARV